MKALVLEEQNTPFVLKDVPDPKAGPAEAVARGADHLVVGRPIRTASDPKNAAKKILDEIADAVSTQTE